MEQPQHINRRQPHPRARKMTEAWQDLGRIITGVSRFSVEKQETSIMLNLQALLKA